LLRLGHPYAIIAPPIGDHLDSSRTLAMDSLSVVVLAAGKGTRMRSALPKVLHTLAGKPLLAHVLDRAVSQSANRVVVVYGHGGEQVRNAFNNPRLCFALQEPQLGTGHALMQAIPYLPDEGT